jgi:hypothetical protein
MRLEQSRLRLRAVLDKVVHLAVVDDFAFFSGIAATCQLPGYIGVKQGIKHISVGDVSAKIPGVPALMANVGCLYFFSGILASEFVELLACLPVKFVYRFSAAELVLEHNLSAALF